MMESVVQYGSEQSKIDETAVKQLFEDESLAVTIEVHTDERDIFGSSNPQQADEIPSDDNDS